MIKKDDRLIVALDVADEAICRHLISSLEGTVSVFKIGSELFTRFGPRCLDWVRQAGGNIFLDLKFYDIPNTVAAASRAAAEAGVMMFNVHASGGRRMMAAAREAVDEVALRRPAAKPLLLAVTLLTSFNREEAISVYGPMKSVEERVLEFAREAKETGLDGVVASAMEATLIRRELGSEFVIVTPGVRPEGSDSQDQNRVLTPQMALRAGADFLVIGRPITKAKDPKQAAEDILKQMQ